MAPLRPASPRGADPSDSPGAQALQPRRKHPDTIVTSRHQEQSAEPAGNARDSLTQKGQGACCVGTTGDGAGGAPGQPPGRAEAPRPPVLLVLQPVNA